MRLVYMDESGVSNLKHEPHVVQAGVIVNADKALIRVEKALRDIVERKIPREHWDTFVFHATELFNGGGPVFKRDDPKWPIEKRLEIADELAALPAKFELHVALGYAKRDEIPSEILEAGSSNVMAQAVAFAKCAFRVENWMRANAADEVCMLVIEDTDSARSIIRKAQSRWQQQDRIASNLPIPFRHIKQKPLFEEKTPGSVLQLADFCAYVCKRGLMNDERYDRFGKPMESWAV
jgi:hypothetical protein